MNLYIFGGMVVFFLVLITLAYRFEKRMTWPYSDLQSQPQFEDPSGYGLRRVAEATQAGFTLLGWSHDLKGGIYRVNYALLISLDRTILAVVGAGSAPDPHPAFSGDEIVAIEPAGEEEVYDLTVPVPACWLADGIVSHNSGQIEQDADLVMFIYREEVYKPTEENRGRAQIIIAKQRNGPIGNLDLAFIREYTKFEELEWRNE